MTHDQDVVNEGALFMVLLLALITEFEDRPRNAEDDLIMEGAMDWVEEFSDVIHVDDYLEH